MTVDMTVFEDQFTPVSTQCLDTDPAGCPLLRLAAQAAAALNEGDLLTVDQVREAAIDHLVRRHKEPSHV